MMAFGGATIALLFRMVELMNPGRIPIILILIGSNNVSRGSDEEEAQWESMMVCLFTTLWQKFKCAVLTVCTVPMSTETLTWTGRRHNEDVIRWNNILRNLASRNVGRMILIDIEHELRAIEQARLTTDGIHFDSIEGQAWLNQVFQERLDEIKVALFDTGVLKKEETTNEPAISALAPLDLETHLARAKDRSTGLIGRSANKKNHSSRTKIRTYQSDRGDDKHLEIRDKIRDNEYQLRGATTRQELFDVVEAHTFYLAY